MDETQKTGNSFSLEQLIERTKALLIPTWKFLLITSVSVFTLFLAIYLLRPVLHISARFLTDDPTMLGNLPFYYGIFSNFGVMLWASAAAINLLGAALLKDDSRKFRFLFVSGLFTLWLGLDDLLLFHETVFPDYIGIPEGLVYIGYVFVILAYLAFFYKDIYTYTNYTLLVVALAAFGSSSVLDNIMEAAFIEDGAKFLGIILWCSYYFLTVQQLVNKRMTFKQE
jgi:hypothetical protein